MGVQIGTHLARAMATFTVSALILYGIGLVLYRRWVER
jgi:hypothetical protein